MNQEPEKYLIEENRRLRMAGFELAEAALHVAKNYDGVLAVSNWAKVVADEGGRGRGFSSKEGVSSKGETGDEVK